MQRKLTLMGTLFCAICLTLSIFDRGSGRSFAAPVPKEVFKCNDCDCRMWTGFKQTTSTGDTYREFYLVVGLPPYDSYATAYPLPPREPPNELANSYCAVKCDEGLPELARFYNFETMEFEVFQISERSSLLGVTACTFPGNCVRAGTQVTRTEGSPTNPTPVMGTRDHFVCSKPSTQTE